MSMIQPAFTMTRSRQTNISDQELLLLNGHRSNLSLDECLNRAGVSLDDLRYTINSSPSTRTTIPRRIKRRNIKMQRHDVPMVSFFAGAGGLDIGMEQAGFFHVALFEKNQIFCDTMRHNRPHWPVVGPPTDSGDVSQTDEIIGILENKFCLSQGFPGVFTGGPPCQPFSIAANQRFKKTGRGFKRTGYANTVNGMLLFDFGRIILHFMPRVFMVENVSGLIDVDGGAQINAFCKEMARAGYDVNDPLKLRAEMFGVPQFRERVFIVGGRGRWTPPAKWPETIACSSVLTDDVSKHQNHQPRNHKIQSILRYRILDFGKRDYEGRVDRLHPYIPSKTVIAGGMKGGGRSHLHPWIPRTLSVRESARLQTFPDNYVFKGAIARQFTQVGNAVPPLLGRQLGESIYQSYYA